MSVLHRNSVHHRACTALISTHDTSESEDSGASDNGPVLAQHAEQEALALDRERFTQTRRSCLEPDRSVGKVPVGEPSLSAGAECLSLHATMLAQQEKSGNGNPATQAPDKDSAFLPSRERRRASCLGFGEVVHTSSILALYQGRLGRGRLYFLAICIGSLLFGSKSDIVAFVISSLRSSQAVRLKQKQSASQGKGVFS